MVNAIENMFLTILKEFTGNDLRYAINRNVNLANLMLQLMPPQQIQFFRILATPFSGKKDELNTKKLILFLSERRPDFAEILNNNGMAESWLDYNIKSFKKLLW